MLAAGIAMMLAAAAAPAAWAPQAPATIVSATATVQQLFDTATAAANRGERAVALAHYDALERRLARAGKAASLAILRARRGVLLLELGRSEEAAPALLYAQANLSRDLPALRDDRYLVALSLGRIEEQALDYAAARRWYEAAEKEADATFRPVVWISLARIMMFDDAPAALALIDRVIAARGGTGAEGPAVARYRTLRGRVLLNARNYPAAEAELKRAVADLGGLTTRLDQDDVAARSDFAIAAMLNGHEEAAREYLAFTGAGTLRDVLSPPSDGEAPPCGGPADLKPEDVAVVHFVILRDGSVSGVAPIYASRAGVAQAFARAVAGWSWTVEEAAKIKPFFRSFVRVELRCATSTDRPGVVNLFEGAVADWFAVRKVAAYEPPRLPVTSALAHAEAELRRREAGSGSTSPDLLPLLTAIVGNPLVDRAARAALATRAVEIAASAAAPAPVIAFFGVAEAQARAPSGGSARDLLRHAALLEAVAARPAIAGDPKARAGVWLLHADTLMGTRRREAALPVLQQVVDDAALGARDPLKVGAWLRLASIRAWQKDLPAAREAYARTGLAAQECALVDARPALLDSNSGSRDFPREAIRWGFEGWVLTEFDIGADGRTSGARALMAYPPFVFSPAATSVMARARFTQTYRPEGGLGCGGQTQRIRFGVPGK